jgi:cation transport ATPase
MQIIKPFILLVIIASLLSSCSITKCRYSNGLNIDLGLGKKQDKVTIIRQKELKLKSPTVLREKAEIIDLIIENSFQTSPINAYYWDTQYHIINDNNNTIKQAKFKHNRTQNFAQNIVQNELRKTKVETKKHSKPTKTSDFLIELLKIFIFLLAFLVYMISMVKKNKFYTFIMGVYDLLCFLLQQIYFFLQNYAYANSLNSFEFNISLDSMFLFSKHFLVFAN